MKTFIKQALAAAAAILLMLGLATSCKDKKQSKEEQKAAEEEFAEQYAEQLELQAEKLNEQCPRQLPNGVELMSVTFKDNTQLYRYRITNQQELDIEGRVDEKRDSIIASLTDNEKEYLINGKCSQKHLYVAPDDSIPVVITPADLEDDSE